MSVVAEQEEAEARLVRRWHPVGPEVTASLHGTHELHRYVGRWTDGDIGSWVVLRDKRTSEAVLDLAGVKSALVCWRADGALLARLSGMLDTRLFIVAPDIVSFQNVGFDTQPRPISDLQAAVDGAAREIAADGAPSNARDGYVQHDFSPEGEVMVRYSIETQRMSHETRMPSLIDVATGDVLMTMPDTLHDGQISWMPGTRCQLYVRHYDDGRTAAFVVDYAQRTFWLTHEPDRKLPLRSLHKEIKRAIARSTTSYASGPMPQRTNWRAIFLVTVLAALLIAGGTFVSLALDDRPKQKLATVPELPPSLRQTQEAAGDPAASRMPVGDRP